MAQTLNENASSLEAANWSGAGFGDNAELVIEDSEAEFTDLDRTGDTTDTTGGIHYLHVRGGSPQFGPDNGHLKIEWEGSGGTPFTARSNFIWQTVGGLCHLEFSGAVANHEVQRADFIGGGQVFLHEGELVKGVIGARNAVIVNANCDISSKLVVSGHQCSSWLKSSSDSLPELVLGRLGGRVNAERRVELCNMAAGVLMYNARSLGALTTLNQFGGLLVPQSGDITTWNYFGGDWDFSRFRRDLTIGTLNNFSGRPSPRPTGGVSISTINDHPEEVVGSIGSA